MYTKRDQLMQEVETYGNGLLSDETVEYTVDIIMECDPVPDSIDLIDIDSIIRAVEDHDTESLSYVYELEYDPDAIDWYLPMNGLPDVYLGIGDVDVDDALNYALRYMSGRGWNIKYRISLSDSFRCFKYYSERYNAVERAFKQHRAGRCHTNVDQVALCCDDRGIVRDEYVIRRII